METTNQSTGGQTCHRVSVTVPGDILSTNVGSVRQCLANPLQDLEAARGSFLFELDLQAARMIDSVGLNLLVWLIKNVQRLGGRTRLIIADINIDRTFQFTRLNQYAEVVHRGAARIGETARAL